MHDGQYSTYRKRRFGAPAADVPPERFVVFCQNHDQVGNRAYGDRLPREARPLAAFCTLLSPFTPMLFMGEEHGEPAPFQFFSDHVDAKIATATRKGRRREFAAFAQFGERDPRPAEPSDLRGVEAHPRARPGAGAPLRAADRGAAAASSRGRGRGRVGRARALAAGAAGPFELVCNFSREPARVPCGDGRVVLATHGDPRPAGGSMELEPLSGALLAR